MDGTEPANAFPPPMMAASSELPAKPTLDSIVVPTPPMKRGKGLWMGITVGVLVVAAVVGAVAWNARKSDPTYSLSASVAATAKITSVRFEMDLDSDGTKVPLSGLMDVQGRLMQFELDGASFTGDASTGKISALMDLDKLVMYVSGDFLGAEVSQQMPDGKTFIRMNLKKLAEKNGQDLSALTSGASSDPLSSARLVANSTKTTDLGREPILNGIMAEHYRFEVNMDDALKAAGTTREKLIGSSGVTLPDTVVYDAWIDVDNHVRRLEYSLDTGTQSMIFSIRYTEINPVVDITLPSDTESVDLFDLMGG